MVAAHHRRAAKILLILGLVSAGRGLSSAPAAAKLAFDVKPTVFFIEDRGVLRQRLDIRVDNLTGATSGTLEVRLPAKTVTFPLKKIGPGASVVSVLIPEIQKAAKVRFVLRAGKTTVRKDVKLSPQRKWTLYLLPNSHSDIGYTELQPRVIKNHLDYLDSVIDFCKATDGYPDEAKFRWNIEIAWTLENYVKSRPPAKVAELVSLMKAGRVELSALYVNLSDCFAHEELIRAVLFAVNFCRTNGLPLLSAMNNDVTGFSWALPQIFSQVGVRYFATGINETRSRAPLRRPNPFYWQSPDGSKILHWNGEHYLFANSDLLIPQGLEKSQPKVVDYLTKLENRGDYPYDLIAFTVSGSFTDNSPPNKALSDRVIEWNAGWAYPKLRLATMSEFFEGLERKYAKALPTYMLGWPDYWTDGVASTAFETGLNRLAHNEMLSAEKMAFAAGMSDKTFAFPAAEILEGYEDQMLYDEHTWGADNSIDEPDSEHARGQWAVKSAFAYNAREIAKTVLSRGFQSLARNIPTGEGWSLAVFNPLSWERSDIVKVQLPAALVEKNGRFKLVEKGSGAEVSYQILDKRTLLFQTFDIPSMGYAVYTIVLDVLPSPPAPVTVVGENTIENRYYRVAVDPKTGGLASVVDKETGLELVDRNAGYSLNQYIYETPVGGRKAVDNMEKRATFVRTSPDEASALPGMQGPGASSLIVRTKAKPCPEIQQEIILYDGIKRVDIVNRLRKDEVYDPEAVYFAYPFQVEGAKLRFEVADATMAPETEQLPGTTRDWHTVQHWVEASGPNLSVVWSPVEAPLVEFGDINTGKWLKKLDLTNASFFSYAMNNYWMTNFKAAQGGAVSFRYSFTTRKGGSDLLSSTRYGWEVHTPLTAVWLPAKNVGTLADNAASFFSVDKPNVIIQAVKRTEDGGGIAVRLREVAGLETQVKITGSFFKSDLLTYTVTDVAEGPANANTVVPGSIYATLKPFGLQTVVIKQ